MKHGLIMTAVGKLNEKDIAVFSKSLAKSVNKDVYSAIQSHSQAGERILIATAAAEFFMPYFVKELGIEADFIATKKADNFEDFKENKGEEKMMNVMKYLATNNYEINTFFTDHYDDLPLLQINMGKNILVNPDKSTLDNIGNVHYEILK